MGVIEDVRTVRIEGTSSGVGAAAGTVVGGVAGSGIGGGRGRVVGAVLGAVAGGVAGSAIEESSTRKPGLELTIRLETGRVIAIVQEDDGTDFRRGDRVRVIGSGGQARVSR
jgi:outer membrane lipoprotein SlyB